jgi:hypothetical protein
MAIPRHQAIEIARGLASKLPGASYAVKPGCASATLRDGDEFSRLLGIDCRHWVVVLEYAVPDDVVFSPDEIMILVAEASGAAELATLM